MAMLGKLISLAKSPQGRRLLNQAQKAARDPQNRERLQQVRNRLRQGKTTPARPMGRPARGRAEAPTGEESHAGGSHELP